MTDEELAEYLHLTPDEAAIVIPHLPPDRRAVYDRMKEVEVQLSLWVKGLGPKPENVLIDTGRRKSWR